MTYKLNIYTKIYFIKRDEAQQEPKGMTNEWNVHAMETVMYLSLPFHHLFITFYEVNQKFEYLHSRVSVCLGMNGLGMSLPRQYTNSLLYFYLSS
jgi:hypothetical protein